MTFAAAMKGTSLSEVRTGHAQSRIFRYRAPIGQNEILNLTQSGGRSNRIHRQVCRACGGISLLFREENERHLIDVQEEIHGLGRLGFHIRRHHALLDRISNTLIIYRRV
jgi:hypothetical protein